jgi:hypothetical protein
MTRQHVDQGKVGSTVYLLETSLWVDDEPIPEGLGRELSSLDEAKAAVTELVAKFPEADYVEIRRGTYDWDPELDFEEVRWVSFTLDEEFRVEGVLDGAWIWEDVS